MYRTGGFICFRKLFVPSVPAGYTRVDVQSRRNTIEEDHGFLAVVLFGCNTLALPLYHSTFLIPFNLIYFHMYTT